MPVWTNTFVTSAAASVAIGPIGTWALGTSSSLESYDPNLTSWTPQVAPPTTFTQIAQANDGTMIGVSSSGDIYLFTAGSWGLTPYTGVHAAITDLNNYVFVDALGVISRYAYGFLATLPSGPTQISTGSVSTAMYGTDSAGNVYEWDETLFAWNTLAGASLSSTFVDATGVLYGVNSAGDGYSYSGGVWTYHGQPTGTVLTWLGHDGVNFWALTSAGDVYSGI